MLAVALLTMIAMAATVTGLGHHLTQLNGPLKMLIADACQEMSHSLPTIEE